MKQFILTTKYTIGLDVKINNQYIATCPRLVENISAQEIKQIGATQVKSYHGGVNFQTTPQKVLKLVLLARTIDRIYKVLFKFRIRSEEDLYKKAFHLPWNEVLSKHNTFKINSVLDSNANRYFKNSMFLSYKLKDAIADFFVKHSGERPNVDTEQPQYPLRLHIEKAKTRGEFFVTISLDLAGTLMSQRGYRKESNMAPLRENLAAALIMATDWQPQSHELFCDPMCGSGTLLIEAALMRLNISPSYLKLRQLIKNGDTQWALQNQLWFLKTRGLKSWFSKECSKLHTRNEQILKAEHITNIFGSELSQDTLKICKMNLRRAALFKHITVKQMNATQLKLSLNQDGVILTNPPYGERMGEITELKKLYHEFTEHLKQNFKNTRLYIFTGNPELRKAISLQTSSRIPFYNGAIECRLLRYEIY